jgi:hypothetical protein
VVAGTQRALALTSLSPVPADVPNRYQPLQSAVIATQSSSESKCPPTYERKQALPAYFPSHFGFCPVSQEYSV